MRIPTLRHAIIEQGVNVAWSHDAICEDAADDILLQGEAFHCDTAETVWSQGSCQEGSIGVYGQTKHAKPLDMLALAQKIASAQNICHQGGQ